MMTMQTWELNMKRIGLNNVIGLLILMLIPALAGAKSMETVSANGASQFYYKTDGEGMAKYKSKEKLAKMCKEKGMVLYDDVDSYQSKNSHRVQYDGMQCETYKGGKKCKTHATGYCVSKLLKSEWFSCGKDKPKVKGVIVPLGHGAMRILTRDDRTINISPETMREGKDADIIAKQLCNSTSSDANVNQYLLRYLRNYVNKARKKCSDQKKSDGKKDKGCDALPASASMGDRS